MIPLPAILLSVLILVALVALTQRAWRDYQAGKAASETTRRVIVHTQDSQSFEGVALRTTARGILLAAASLVPDEGPPTPLVGDLWIPGANVRAVQIVT